MSDPEQRLNLIALHRGERAAWEVAFQQLWPIVVAAVRRPGAGLDAQDVEDVAIDSLKELAAVCTRAGSVDELMALATTLAKRRAQDAWRRKSAAKRGRGQTLSLSQFEDAEESQWEAADPGPTTDRLVEQREAMELAAKALSLLDPPAPAMLRDHFLHGLTLSELAVKYAMPLGSVGVKLGRALKLLRGRLNERPNLLKAIDESLRH